MSNQVKLTAETRTELGKGPTNRLRKTGRVPGIVYGYQVEPTAVAVDRLELYHVLHTAAGTNVLIDLQVDGENHLTVAREIQRHPVKGEILHVDLIAVDKDSQINVEVPVHLTNEDDAAEDGGVVNHVLWNVPILVRPLDVPNSFTMDVAGMAIGDVKRVEDLTDQLPDGAEFAIDPDRTIVTINAPTILEEPEEEELEGEGLLIEGEEPGEDEAAGEGGEAAEAAEEPGGEE